MWFWGDGIGLTGLGFLWLILTFLFWGAIIALIVWGIRFLFSRERSSASHRSTAALDIARERYARGEISRDEFEQMKRDLSD